MRTAIAGAVFYVFGMLVLTIWGLDNFGWQEWYYFWDKGKDLLLFIGLHQLINKKYKWVIVPVIIFSSIRLLWQIISTFTGANINSSKAVGYLFITLSAMCLFIMFKEFLKWRK